MLICVEEPFLSGQAMEPVNFHVKHSKPEFKPKFVSRSWVIPDSITQWLVLTLQLDTQTSHSALLLLLLLVVLLALVVGSIYVPECLLKIPRIMFLKKNIT